MNLGQREYLLNNASLSFRSALQQKKAEEEKQYGAIDYDTPTVPKSNTVGLGTKVILQH